MIKFSLTKTNVSQYVNTLNTIVSAEVEPLKIKFSEKGKLDVLAVDKSTDVDVYLQFPLSEVEKTQLFSLPLHRFRTLLSKQGEINLELKKGMLHYNYGNKTSGSVEIEDCQGNWKYPQIDDASLELNLFIFKAAQTVKLPPAPGEVDSNLFISYKAEDHTLNLAVADNFNIAFMALTDIKFWNHDIELSIPFAYVEYARKLASLSENNKIHIINKEKQCYIHTQNATILLPSYAINDSVINIKTISNQIEKTKKVKNIAFSLNDLQSFMHNSLTIKESDRTAVIEIKLKQGIISYKIETKHGTTQYKNQSNNTVEQWIARVSCAALSLVLSKLDPESETFYKLVGNTFCLVAKTNTVTSYFLLATLGED